jgi:hypothetical protein
MESPFAQHLNTNYAPSDAEVASIQSHLIPHILEVSRLEKVQEYIDAHKALLSPARHLPPDVLQEIFLACLPTDRNAAMSATEAPLLLTCICSAWRALALSTPALWTSLHLPLEFVFDGGPPAVSVKDWLERSLRYPLSLSIVGAHNMNRWAEDNTEEVDIVMDAIIRSGDRWRSLDLLIEANEQLPGLATMHVPQLEALTIGGHLEEISKMRLLTAPSLRTVTIHIKRYFGLWIPRLPFRWGNLTSLKFESQKKSGQPFYPSQGMTPSDVLKVLGQCPQLIHFETDLISFPQSPPASEFESTVSVPALKEFIICRCGSGPAVQPLSMKYLLDHLQMPCLLHLQLPRTWTEYPLALPFLGDLAMRSPLIEKLDIDVSNLPLRCLVDNLHMLPNLRKLVLIDRLTSHRGTDSESASVGQLLPFFTPPICPILNELQLRDVNPSSFANNGQADLLEFARARLDLGGGHLRRLDVEYERYSTFVPPISPEVLASFAERGLTISTISLTRPPARDSSGDRETPWSGIQDLFAIVG